MRPEVQVLLSAAQNEDDPLEKAKLLNSLHKDHDVKIKDIAEQLGYSQAHVCNLTRLLRLPEMIADGYYGGSLSYTHLILLSRLRNPQDMKELYEQTLSESLSTSQLEELVRRRLYGILTKQTRIDESLRTRIERLFHDLDGDTKVTIVQTRIHGTLTVSMKGDTEKTTKIFKKIAQLQDKD